MWKGPVLRGFDFAPARQLPNKPSFSIGFAAQPAKQVDGGFKVWLFREDFARQSLVFACCSERVAGCGADSDPGRSKEVLPSLGRFSAQAGLHGGPILR